MRYYETLYILNPNFELSRVDEIIKEVADEILKYGSVINHRMWGKKRLAYPIQMHKYGIYVLLQYETENTGSLNEFDKFLKLNNSILRHQTIRLDQKPEVSEGHVIDDSEDEDDEIPMMNVVDTTEYIKEPKPETESVAQQTEIIKE